MERTLSLVKPDAFAAGKVGNILGMIEAGGLRIVATKTLRLSRAQAEGFYAVHKERPFFKDLVTFMTSGPIQASVLEGEGAIKRYRDLMGPTNSADAPEGTIRNAFGTDIEKNAVHGSDAPDTAAFEVGYFFSGCELRFG
ncbi:MAG: nucleoside-diphosphate kinase [Myxococcales bacterium]|nr:nucleoside-diphosphate kinase [Myxococcales bacterium]